jgi:hypothetical protein
MMRIKFVSALILTMSFASAHLIAQATSVRVICVCKKADADGYRMQKALEDSIALSGRLSLTQATPFDMPKGGIVIEIYSMQIGLKDGQSIGSAMTIQTLQPSSNERGYFKRIYAEQWMVPADGTVSDTALSYLASVLEKLSAVK